jgi:two-component system cell cycle sensor histidine kinase/response regulator CckA
VTAVSGNIEPNDRQAAAAQRIAPAPADALAAPLNPLLPLPAALHSPAVPKLIRVLLVEDDEDDFLLTRDLLRDAGGARFELQWISDYQAAAAAICSGAFEICLVDYRLGAQNGMEFIRAVTGRCVGTPLILLTGETDREIDLQALKAGAADYLSKAELSAPLLSRSIRYAIERRAAMNQLLLSQEQLRQAQKLEAVGRLAGGVAHDFNNLLTAITGYSELLLNRLSSQSPAVDAVHADLEEIHKAAKRGAALTQQLLTFSRKQIVQPTVLDLNSVVTDLQNMLDRMIGDHIRIDTLPAADLKQVRADRGQIEQVIMNLAINARDAMPAGGRLLIKTANVSFGAVDSASPPPVSDMAPGDYVSLLVSDTGIGMDAETCSHVFEPFFTTKGPGKGTGLGLSTVYGIVQSGGGAVHIQSELGRGAIFTVYLPALTSAQAQTDLRLDAPLARRPAQIRASAPTSAQHASQTILLVEDQDVVRKLVARILKSGGYQVLTASGGEQALVLCREAHDTGGKVDLLLSDVMMAGMNGRELARRVHAAWPAVKVMFISGYTSGELGVGAGGKLEFNATFLQKPFTMEDLLQRVSQALESDPHPAPEPATV